MTWLSLTGCLTPVWPDDAVAPGANAPWNYPTDVVCEKRTEPDVFEVDGFLFCGTSGALEKVAIDDPRYVPCADTEIPPAAEMLALFDGARARGFPLRALVGRELVNTEWEGQPILVDY